MTDEKIITQDGAVLPPEIDEIADVIEEETPADMEYESQFEIASSDSTNAILDAIKELTKAVTDMVKITNAMKASHDKWVRAGKF